MKVKALLTSFALVASIGSASLAHGGQNGKSGLVDNMMNFNVDFGKAKDISKSEVEKLVSQMPRNIKRDFTKILKEHDAFFMELDKLPELDSMSKDEQLASLDSALNKVDKHIDKLNNFFEKAIDQHKAELIKNPNNTFLLEGYKTLLAYVALESAKLAEEKVMVQALIEMIKGFSK